MKYQVEWNEPGLGVCQVWKVGEGWFNFSAPGIEGTSTTFEEAMAEVEIYIAECKEGRAQ
jgi:hypothetical protein